VPEFRSSCVLELGVLLEEHGDLEDYLVEIFFFRVIVRFVGLDCFVVFENRIVLFQLFELDPALTKQILA
jgi:hypothetical protein